MKPSVAIDLHLFFLAEGRRDLLFERPSIRTIVLAAAVWDLLDAGLLWGVPGKSFTVARALPESLQPLEAVHQLIAKQNATRPGALWRSFFLKNPSPADEMAKAIVSHLRSYENIGRHTLQVPAPIADTLVKRVRKAALGSWTGPTDAALLYALSRGTFLRDRYFRGRQEKLDLRNRLKDLQKNPPLAAGWSMERLCRRFFLYDEFYPR